MNEKKSGTLCLYKPFFQLFTTSSENTELKCEHVRNESDKVQFMCIGWNTNRKTEKKKHKNRNK